MAVLGFFNPSLQYGSDSAAKMGQKIVANPNHYSLITGQLFRENWKQIPLYKGENIDFLHPV